MRFFWNFYPIFDDNSSIFDNLFSISYNFMKSQFFVKYLGQVVANEHL